MLLTITTTHNPATDLGYLLGKNPAHSQSFSLNFGTAHVFYPEAGEDRCTVALLMEVDPVGLVRDRAPAQSVFAYVNDRPYVASSFVSVAISRVFGSALGGRSRDRQELAESEIPLEAHLPCVPVKGGENYLRSLFEPLGWEVRCEQLPLDPAFPEWGDSRYFSLTLVGHARLSALLSHLYVLIPVLDGDKHYWVGPAEVEKLLAKGEGWLEGHPLKGSIVRGYLKRQRSLARTALDALASPEEQPEGVEARGREAEIERPIRLHERRHERVVEVIEAHECTDVIDLGCGDGKLLRRLAGVHSLDRIVGVDASSAALERARVRSGRGRERGEVDPRVELIHSGLTYVDSRFREFDCACLVEVIEHIDEPRLPAVEHSVFADARPRVVIVTTPNVEYNVLFENLPAGTMRHNDHRFEWTRAEFAEWATKVCDRYNYTAQIEQLGDEDPELGGPSQMAVFVRGVVGGEVS